MPESTAGETDKETSALTEPDAALTSTVPTAIAFTTPLALTTAIADWDVLQTTFEVMSWLDPSVY